MQYEGPSNDEYTNVHALNRCFLDCLRRRTSSAELRDQEGMQLGDLFAALTGAQVRRLAATPFLLFSVREHDNEYWQRLFTASSTPLDPDLFIDNYRGNEDYAQLLVSTLGFLWQLARRNPYAARLLSGASVEWCEQLAHCTLLQLISVAMLRPELLTLRFSDQKPVWMKLLSSGISAEADIRAAAHLTALQAMLTIPPDAAEPLRAAACHMPDIRRR